MAEEQFGKKKIKFGQLFQLGLDPKGIKNKNIVNLSGKPLIYYTIKDAFKSKKFEKILVLTDSQKYAKIAKSFGAEVPYLRPKSNALDTSTDNELYIYMLDFFRKKILMYQISLHILVLHNLLDKTI